MYKYPNLRDQYPEVERPHRLDGSPESIRKCREPVIKNLERIINLVDDIAHWKKLEYVNMFLFQSRAMGTCYPTSDIDIYIQLKEKHSEFVKTNGIKFADTEIIVLAGSWAEKYFRDIPEHLHEELIELHIGIYWGVAKIPPAKTQYIGRKYYIELKELRNGT